MDHWDNFWDIKKDIGKVYPDSTAFFRPLLTHAGEAEDKRVLEVGAGSGRDGSRLAGEGFDVTVLDYSRQALRVASAVSGNDTAAVLGDAFSLPFPDESFDVVFHQGLLEHFREPTVIIAEQRRVLKPEGLLVVTVPQKYHPYTVAKHILIFVGKWFAGWETEYTIEELERLVAGNGFRVLERYGEWMYPSFFYRSFREVLRKLSLELPMYPGGNGPVHGLRARIRARLRILSPAFYTFITVGVVAGKTSNGKK